MSLPSSIKIDLVVNSHIKQVMFKVDLDDTTLLIPMSNETVKDLVFQLRTYLDVVNQPSNARMTPNTKPSAN